MTCDQFLPAIAIGGAVRRRLALRHAAQCPACAAALAAHRAMAERLADAPALTDRERQLWTRAAIAVESGPAGERLLGPAVLRNVRRLAWLGGAACAVVTVVVFTRRPAPTPPPAQFAESRPHPATTEVESPVVRTPVSVTAANPLAEVTRLSADLDRLDGELSRLQRKAERAEARRQVAVALDRADRW